jgi:hypothetical protein
MMISPKTRDHFIKTTKHITHKNLVRNEVFINNLFAYEKE